MTVDPGKRTEGLGVVDPVTIPGAARAVAAWGSLPLVGRAFVVAALVDLVVRALGVGGLSLGVAPEIPITIVSAFLPHVPLILLPVVLLLRRRDAAIATPRLFQGAVVLALVELLAAPLQLRLSAIWPDVTPWIAVQIGGFVAQAVGYVLLGLGLDALRTAQPRPTLAGAANLAAGLIGAAALMQVALVVLHPPDDTGIPGAGGLLFVAAIAPLFGALGLAFLARVIVRGGDDEERPVVATTLAAGAVTLAAVNAFLAMIASLFVLAGSFITIPAFVAGLGLGWAGYGLPLTLLVVALGLGLAGTSVRMEPRGPEPVERPDEGGAVRWPEPGGEVPAFLPVEPPGPQAAPNVASKRPRRKSKETPG